MKHRADSSDCMGEGVMRAEEYVCSSDRSYESAPGAIPDSHIHIPIILSTPMRAYDATSSDRGAIAIHKPSRLSQSIGEGEGKKGEGKKTREGP